MSLRTPNPLSVFQEGLGQRLQINLARREQPGNGTRYFVKYQIPFLHEHLTFRREDSFSGVSIISVEVLQLSDVVLLKVLAMQPSFHALTRHQLFRLKL